MVRTLLLESYFGKNKTLIEVETYLTSLKNKMKKGMNPNKCDEIELIEKKIGNLFNIKNINLMITPEEGVLSASVTSFLSFNEFKKDEKYYSIIKTNTGFRFKRKIDKEVIIRMSSYLIREKTEEEIIAVLLHEIGHEFFYLTKTIDASRYI
ncbi:hypothetical protein DA469_21840, partial [Bacillus subtilis]